MSEHAGQILLIEDDEATREGLAMFFNLEGYEAIAVDSYAAAVELLQREPFGLVIADSPGKTWDASLGFLGELRPHLGTARLVLHSAHLEAALLKPEQHGLDGVWTKPFDLAVMSAVLPRLLLPG